MRGRLRRLRIVCDEVRAGGYLPEDDETVTNLRQVRHPTQGRDRQILHPERATASATGAARAAMMSTTAATSQPEKPASARATASVVPSAVMADCVTISRRFDQRASTTPSSPTPPVPR